MSVPQLIAGRFQIECKIGTGGMGTVYRAKQLGLERPVAVKIIKSEFAADRDLAERFMREARTMARLHHRHAAMIFDAGSLPDGRHFIVMEYVEGITLSQALSRQGYFPAPQAVKIAIQICEVLEEAHQLGIIHRDLKPSNIMLNERGVCVLDFGVAKVLVNSADSTSTHASTGSGQIVGTPRYMSPEQCLGQRVGARSDLYSLGVLLYEMLAGRPPFVETLPSAMLVKQATAAPPPLPHLRKDVPRALALVVHTLLAKRPENRPRTAADARALLEGCLAGPKRTVAVIEPLAATVANVGARSSSVVRLAAPIAIVVGLGALLLVWGNSGETARIPANRTSSPVEVKELPARKEEKQTARIIPSKSATKASSASLSPERARRLISALGYRSISDIQVVQTRRGQAIVAIQEERKRGTTRFILFERRGKHYRVVDRGALDTADFRHAEWTAQSLDADDDGYHEVVFAGIGAKGKSSVSRLVLYVPVTRDTYSLVVEKHGRSSKSRRAIWSANAASIESAPYRVVLREKLNELAAQKR